MRTQMYLKHSIFFFECLHHLFVCFSFIPNQKSEIQLFPFLCFSFSSHSVCFWENKFTWIVTNKVCDYFVTKVFWSLLPLIILVALYNHFTCHCYTYLCSLLLKLLILRYICHHYFFMQTLIHCPTDTNKQGSANVLTLQIWMNFSCIISWKFWFQLFSSFKHFNVHSVYSVQIPIYVELTSVSKQIIKVLHQSTWCDIPEYFISKGLFTVSLIQIL